MSEIIYVDFKTGTEISRESHDRKEKMRLDPVLEQVKSELPPDHFEIYHRTVEDWMRRNYEYQMEHNEGKLYE